MSQQFSPVDVATVLRIRSLRSSATGFPLLPYQGQPLRAYPLDVGAEVINHGEARGILSTSIGCIGVEEGEPFLVEITNPSSGRVQVKLALDGTDYLTGKPADLDLGPMLLLGPRETATIKAWREGEAGGAAFVFTTKGKSVAAHTHGDLRAAMTISLAVWFEGEPGYMRSGILRSMSMDDTTGSLEAVPCSASMDSFPMRGGPAKSMGVGAGAFTEQRFTEATGLRKPVLRNLITLHYMAADDLERVCAERGLLTAGPNVVAAGFPGAAPRIPFVDLGSTPRQGPPSPTTRPSFNRFA